MTASNFKPSFNLTLAHEGGYVNHPKDPGGATNQGVTQRVYDAYRKGIGATQRSVRLITADEVLAIYKNQYWKLVRGDSLPTGLDYAVYDFAVNSGVARAIRYLQRVVGVEDDAVIGMETLAATYEAAKRNEQQLIATYCAHRMAFLRSLDTFSTFGKGWTRRVVGYIAGAQDTDSGVLDYAIAMAKADTLYVMPNPMPKEIGKLPSEVPAKAYSLVENEFPMPAKPMSYAELKLERWA
jgi:lysozyme family protein